MRHVYRLLFVAALIALQQPSNAAAATVGFDDLSLAPQSFDNGADGAGQFISGGAIFQNHFTDFGGGFSSWEGWSYSNRTDVATPGFEND